MTTDIVHDKAARRFTLDRSGRRSHLTYRLLDSSTVDFVSTWVDPALRGRGIGARLVEHALEWADRQDLQVLPSCWFVAEFIAHNPRYRPLAVAR
ncbi:MAG TPA: GNAT family N-acetyltransferase [Thermoanaerobaculia bacterium]|nr:GNAT family N-acetyltransferase [Thermoanaerobaculia bacterium]